MDEILVLRLFEYLLNNNEDFHIFSQFNKLITVPPPLEVAQLLTYEKADEKKGFFNARKNEISPNNPSPNNKKCLMPCSPII